MPAPLSMDLRVRIVAAYDAGETPAEVAQAFSVTERTVFNLLALRKETGRVEPRPGQVGPKPKLDQHREKIVQTIRNKPGLTLEELRTQLGLPGCLSTLWNALQRWGITLKKSPARL